MRVEHERDVDPPGPGPDIGEVRHPQLVGAEPREVPVDQIRRSNLLHGRVGGLAPLAAGDADQPELAHQPFDGAAGDVVPITPQPQPELARPVTAVLRLPGLGDDRLPVLVALLPLRGPAAAGVVVGRWGRSGSRAR